MFVGAFQDGLREGHFNKSLANRPATSLAEVVKRVECYIKDEESNVEKKVYMYKNALQIHRGHEGTYTCCPNGSE